MLLFIANVDSSPQFILWFLNELWSLRNYFLYKIHHSTQFPMKKPNKYFLAPHDLKCRTHALPPSFPLSCTMDIWSFEGKGHVVCDLDETIPRHSKRCDSQTLYYMIRYWTDPSDVWHISQTKFSQNKPLKSKQNLCFLNYFFQGESLGKWFKSYFVGGNSLGGYSAMIVKIILVSVRKNHYSPRKSSANERVSISAPLIINLLLLLLD